MKRKFFIVAAIILFGLPVRAEQPKSLFYLTRDPKSVRSFLAHADKIDILVPHGIPLIRTASSPAALIH